MTMGDNELEYKLYEQGDLSYQTVKAVGITQPLVEGIETPQQLIAYTARVSNKKNQLNTDTHEKLLKYCAKHSHWSVFEMANIVFEVTTTRDIARQLLRHRSINAQELSQRYTNPTEDLFFVVRDARLQDSKNRQNSLECDDESIKVGWGNVQKYLIMVAYGAYKIALERGIAKEQARCVLPEGNTGTRLYINTNVRSIIHYCTLRMGVETQKEHRDLAEKMWVEACDHFSFLHTLNNSNEVT